MIPTGARPKPSELAVVDIPTDHVPAFGGLKQHRVRKSLTGVEFASNVMPAGNGRLAPSVSKAMMAASRLTIGDNVTSRSNTDDDQAWYLYGELWELSATARPELSPSERGGQIDELLDPLLDGAGPDDDPSALVVNVFRALLAARIAPLFAPTAPSVGGD